MCLYPILIKNPKYLPNKKNGFCPPKIKDERVKYVPIGCGKCFECRRQKAGGWKVRLEREMRLNPLKAYFVTLTFNDQSLQELEATMQKGEEKKDGGQQSACAIVAMKRWRERYRKKYKKSIRHWMVTERGQTATHRLHLHGIIWTEHDIKEVMESWQYGFTYTGLYCNLKTVNYVVKYVLKVDHENLDFQGRILASPGIGDWGFAHDPDGGNCQYRGRKTEERYRRQNGSWTGLPIYLRNKIYNEKQREALWLFRLDRQERWVNGCKFEVRTRKGQWTYYQALQYWQKQNEQMGFGKRDPKEREDYQSICKKIKDLTHNKLEEIFEKRTPIRKKQLYLQL